MKLFCTISIGITVIIITSVMMTVLLYPNQMKIRQNQDNSSNKDFGTYDKNPLKNYGFEVDDGIDIVILWLDQKSKMHIKDWKDFDKHDIDEKNLRIADRTPNFIQYFMRFVWENISWVRRIHIVVPSFDNLSFVNTTHPKINIIRHNDIIKNESLPNFNWRSVFSHIIGIEEIS